MCKYKNNRNADKTVIFGTLNPERLLKVLCGMEVNREGKASERGMKKS